MLILLKHSEVGLHGIVQGNVVNRGGHLHVYGQVHGSLVKESGTSIVDPKAKVNEAD